MSETAAAKTTEANASESGAKGRVSGKNVFKMVGAIIGFMIGAGFATGQETLQYYTSEGFWGLGGVLVAYGFVFWLFYCFMVTGQRTQLRHSKDVFQYYCGKYLGWVYEILALVMLFLVTVTMVASVGSIVSQYFGVNEIIGRAVMTLLVMASVLLGLRKLLDILGPLGPVIVIGIIVIAVVACVAVFGVSFLPYGELMNAIYPFAGYASYLMIFCMIVKHARLAIAKKRGKDISKGEV